MALPPSKRQSNNMIMETIRKETEIRPWSDLPHELLSTVADDLGIVDLLSFRGTCKDWQSSSSAASAQIESSPDTKPWFLLHQEGNPQCLLHNLSGEKKYNINIPELKQSTCLASNQGWLLLYNNGLIFFFCPFSRAKIDLPIFPHWMLTDHVATFSAPPTSEECIICVINRVNELELELNFLKRGDNIWDAIYYECHRRSFNTITGATFQEGEFHFLDKDKKVLTYSLNKNKWDMYKIVKSRSLSSGNDIDCLPFLYKRNYFQSNRYLKNWLENWGENVWISTCGTIVGGGYDDWDTVIKNEKIIQVSKDSLGLMLKGIWIHPRFHQIPPNQSWSL